MNSVETHVRQTPQGANRYIESPYIWRSGEGDGSITVRLDASGQVLRSFRIDVSGDYGIDVEAPEIPARVRVNEQTTILDRKLTSDRIHYDADGRPDPLDIAAWRRVIGIEPIQLQGIKTPVSAVRIDQWVKLRYYPTTVSGTAEKLRHYSFWYAPNLGLVRAVEYALEEGRPLQSDLRLLGTASPGGGVGMVLTPHYRLPGDTPITSPFLFDKIAQTPNGQAWTLGQYNFKSYLVRIDGTGRVVTTELIDANALQGRKQMFLCPTADGGAAIGLLETFAERPLLDLHVSDSSGKPAGSPLLKVDHSAIPALPPYTNEELRLLKCDPSGTGVWVGSHVRGNSSDSVRVWRVDFSTRRAGFFHEHALPSYYSNISLTLGRGGVAVTYVKGNQFGQWSRVYLRLGEAGTVVATSTLADPPDSTLEAFLLSDGQREWLTWKTTVRADPLLQSAHAWRLSLSGEPEGVAVSEAAAQSANQQLNDPLWRDWPIAVMADRGQWWIAKTAQGRLYTDVSATRGWISLTRLTPSANESTAGATQVCTIQLPFAEQAPANAVSNVSITVLPDRLIAVGTDQQFSRTAVIFPDSLCQ